MARPTKPKAVSSTPRPVETKPKKHVTFLLPSSTRPIALSPLPPTPSPSYSQSSLPSTSSLWTPPSATYHLLPSHIPPHAFSPIHQSAIVLPPAVPSVHDLLSSPHGVRLDVAYPPHPDVICVHPTHLDQFATSPPMHTMKLTAHGLPWAIRVEPSESFPCVTVGDVLYALYTSLHMHVKKDEWETNTKAVQDSVSVAWHGRLDRISNYADRLREGQKGVRRIDFLLGRTCVRGLRFARMSSKGETNWVVDFGT